MTSPPSSLQKYACLLAFLFLATAYLRGQVDGSNHFLLSKTTIKGGISIAPLDDTAGFTVKKFHTLGGEELKGLNVQANLRGNDLTYSFFLPSPEPGFFYRVKNILPPGTAHFQLPPPEIINGTDTLKLVWTDATEQPLYTTFDYSWQLDIELLGPINCRAERPTFTLKREWPAVAGVVTGLVSIGVGQVFLAEKRKAESDYLNSWEEGLPESASSNFIFEDADKAHKAAGVFLHGGIGLLAVSSTVLFIRRLQLLKRQKRYDQYCNPPAIEVIPASTGPGLGLSYRF